jgi:A/G-specific adenine glycosylase
MHLISSDFNTRLFSWYAHNHRSLPWRETQDPYRIWLSEVILQQTRVVQGLPYYKAFVAAYPDVQLLAAASETEVLRLWQGLGYYARARNMLHTARQIAFERNGIFPDNYKDLLKLKGIGSYTAAAIASFAFGEKVAVLDGNVFRVLSRLFAVRTDIATPKARKEFADLAENLIPAEDPATFNQAIMELGALVCTPQSPDCLLCPFNTACRACLTGKQTNFPVKGKKAAVKTVYFQYFVFEFQGKIALKKRQEKSIWEGLYDFYLIEAPDFEQLNIPEDNFLKDLFQKAEVMEKAFTQMLTHRQVKAKFNKILLTDEKQAKEVAERLDVQFYSSEEVEKLPKPLLIQKFIKEQILTQN